MKTEYALSSEQLKFLQYKISMKLYEDYNNNYNNIIRRVSKNRKYDQIDKQILNKLRAEYIQNVNNAPLG